MLQGAEIKGSVHLLTCITSTDNNDTQLFAERKVKPVITHTEDNKKCFFVVKLLAGWLVS